MRYTTDSRLRDGASRRLHYVRADQGSMACGGSGLEDIGEKKRKMGGMTSEEGKTFETLLESFLKRFHQSSLKNRFPFKTIPLIAQNQEREVKE